MRFSLLVLVLASACWRSSPATPVTPRDQKREDKPIALTPATALARIESAYRGGVQRCYESWLKRDPSAGGDIVVTFTVAGSGKLASAEAKGVHRSVELCVESAMMKWSFPPPAEEMTIRLALRLSSRT